MEGVNVKQEIGDTTATPRTRISDTVPSAPVSVIELSSSSSGSSDSDSDSEDDAVSGDHRESRASLRERKRQKKLSELGLVLPAGFLEPLSVALPPTVEAVAERPVRVRDDSCRQFWKAGDYEGARSSDWDMVTGGMDHVRVHPKFLHSNATSHKWALGAFAELLDNSLDEVCNGATYANIDMLVSRKDGSRMLLIEDDGGGMDPEKMRQCMSLGYSAKSKIANTIGQYGNGFKTSTMRLGADVIVFSRCCGKDGRSFTQSIGLLSYTFLRSTGKEDIVVPMLDYERRGQEWTKIIRSSPGDWNRNVETIVEWSPFSSEADLLNQFNMIKNQGTRIIIYNLWENDQGLLELDFDADEHDIQLRGVNRDEKNIKMAKEYPNSRHFLTYRHSLRSYASILYLRLPPGFRIILRGIDVVHHNIVNDMMMSQEITYRPNPNTEGLIRESNMAAVVTIGFVKDAKHHIDVQGFNVYHKNRLIKPFWRLWNASGSDGRGVIGVLEANFVEPAHDKQGFERTTVLARLENRLVQMQKSYWSNHCHKIGYAPRRNKKHLEEAPGKESSPDSPMQTSVPKKSSASAMKGGYQNGHSSGKGKAKYGNGASFSEPLSAFVEEDEDVVVLNRGVNGSSQKASPGEKSFGKDRLRRSSRLEANEAQQDCASGGTFAPASMRSQAKEANESQQDCASGGISARPSKRSQAKGQDHSVSDSGLHSLDRLEQENNELRKRLEEKEAEVVSERAKCTALESQLEAANKQIEELNKEQDSLIDIFSEERERRERQEEDNRKQIREASSTIETLVARVKFLESLKIPATKKTSD